MPEREPTTYYQPEGESAPQTLPNLKRNLRKPLGGVRGAFAAAAVALTGVIASTSAQAENPQDYQEPQVPGSHPTEALTDSNLAASDLLLNYPSPANATPIETNLKDPDSTSLSAQAATGPLTDSDGDGCSDAEELAPVVEIGGQRDPANPWDFFDLNGDKRVNIIDLQRVAYRFGVTQGNPLYAPQYDRSVIGPNNWNLGPGDGAITSVDLMASFVQYGHRCGLLPQIGQEFAQRIDELTADTTPPEIEGVELWQLYCYPSREAYEADAADNELNPPVECSNPSGAATEPGLDDIINKIDRTGPICIEDPEVTPTPACSPSAPTTSTESASPDLRTITNNYDPYDCYRSFNAIWETDSNGNPPASPGNGTHFLWVAGEQCPKNPFALGHTAYSQCYKWDTGTWACTWNRGGKSSDVRNPYLVPGVKQWARNPVYVPPFYGLNCRRLKVAHWVMYEDGPVLQTRIWYSYSPQTVCF